MIHFAGQRSGREVLAPLPELVEYDILSGMLQGKNCWAGRCGALARQ